MKEIPLTQDKFAIVDEDDYEFLMQFKWRITSKGYATYSRKPDCKMILMHRVLMGVENEPRNVFVDHKNHNPLDNRRSNLRVCDHAHNQWNKSKRGNTSSRYKGVSWDSHSARWRAEIGFNNKRTKIGNFKDERDAAAAYNAKALELFGEYACINDL